MAELTAWAAAPEIRLWAEAYREIAGHSLITSAIAALVETMKATENLVEKRRAAQAILRAHQTPRRQPTLAAAAASSPSGGGAALRGGGGSVPTPPTQPPPRAGTSTLPTEPRTNLRLSSPSPASGPTRPPLPPAPPLRSSPASALFPTPHSSLPTALLPPLSPFASRPSPLSHLTSAAGLAGPAP